MEFPLSGRPLTSVPASSEVAPTATPEISVTSTTIEDTPFVPNVFDFVSLAGRAKRTISSAVPPLFLGAQAVDSSTHIGDGASFAVSRRALPKAEVRNYETELGGLVITGSTS